MNKTNLKLRWEAAKFVVRRKCRRLGLRFRKEFSRWTIHGFRGFCLRLRWVVWGRWYHRKDHNLICRCTRRQWKKDARKERSMKHPRRYEMAEGPQTYRFFAMVGFSARMRDFEADSVADAMATAESMAQAILDDEPKGLPAGYTLSLIHNKTLIALLDTRPHPRKDKPGG